MSMCSCIRGYLDDFIHGLLTLETDEEVSDYVGGYRYATDKGKMYKPESLAWRIGNDNGFGAVVAADQENA